MGNRKAPDTRLHQSRMLTLTFSSFFCKRKSNLLPYSCSIAYYNNNTPFFNLQWTPYGHFIDTLWTPYGHFMDTCTFGVPVCTSQEKWTLFLQKWTVLLQK